MRRFIPLLMALILVAAACGDDDTATTGPTTTSGATTTTPEATTTSEAAVTTTTGAATTTAPSAEAVSGLRIAQVGFDTDFQDGWVLIENAGSAPASLAGHFLCQRPGYFALPDVEIEPGAVFWVAVGDGASLQDTPSVAAGGTLGGFSQASGEMGLYDSNSFGDSSSILSYVEWGSAGHGRSSVAIEAGIWVDGEFVTGIGEAIGAILSEAGQPVGAASWETIEAP